MDLMHNSTFLLFAPGLEGAYRVLALDRAARMVACVKFDDVPKAENAPVAAEGKAKNSASETKADRRQFLSAARNCASMIWMPMESLEQFAEDNLVREVDIELDGAFHNFQKDPLKFDEPVDLAKLTVFENRVYTMSEFLDPDKFEESIVEHRDLSQLVERAMERSKRGKSGIYKLISLLCRNGFSQVSLRTREDRQGGPGKSRPCDPGEGGRQKSGALTTGQKIADAYNEPRPQTQPAMSSEWASRILAADKRIAEPKPKMPDRCDTIIRIGFCKRFKQVDGKLTELPEEQFSAPNQRQIIRVLKKRIPALDALKQSTTQGHFLRNLRGLTGHSWQGVGGPGHTWAMDSGVGDVYLVSSLNRAWIIGRPVVYVIVDVWSTAIVGFFVCLRGPSWDMAKQAFFSAAAGSNVMSGIYGFDCSLGLSPEPTLCVSGLFDRGEYLSRAARLFGKNLMFDLSYAPPYRPDLKGVVEVIHRIEKDSIVLWIPGAGDARRKELELRGFRPNDAVMTLQEFISVLYIEFSTYNITASREHRVDAAMKMAGVHPTPAGLWRWGHEVGIGYRRKVSEADLYSNTLPSGKASITRSGIRFNAREYECQQAKDEQWTTIACNFGGSTLDVRHFGGSTSRIWTPNPTGKGLLQLDLTPCSTASGLETDDEILDSNAFHLLSKGDREYASLVARLKARTKADEIIAQSAERTREAKARDRGPKPSITEARNLENAVADPSSSPPVEPPREFDLEERDAMFTRLEEETRRRMEAEGALSD